MHEIVVALEGVRCAACAWLVARVLSMHPAVVGAEVNPAGAGIWEVPSLGRSKPGIGEPYTPGFGG